MNNFLQDESGNKSSKRLIGIILSSVGGALCLALFIFSLFKPVGDPETAKYCCFTLLGAGVGLLGAGVIEKFKPTDKGGK